MHCYYDNTECDQIDTSGMNQIVPCHECGRYNDGIRDTGALPNLGIKEKLKQYQLVNWKEWKGFHFFKGDPTKSPAAFHLIYKWSMFFGWFEVRKFLTTEEMNKALKIYNNQNLDK